MTTVSTPSSQQPFDSLLNFRDVGLFINTIACQPLLKIGLLFRSARPDSATKRDRERLTSEYKIATIIDLRTESEHLDQTRKHSRMKPHSAPALSPSDPSLPLQIPRVAYKDINFNGSAYSKALIKQLSYWHVAKLGGLYAMGYRNEAISVLGTNVMAQRGLTGLAIDSLRSCTAEVKLVFDVLANRASYPLVIHCTQGKDRTGLTVLLVLLLLDVPEKAVKADYMLSQDELAPEREDRLKDIGKIGLPESFADCDPDWVREVTSFIVEERGGVEQYLESCGVGMQQREKVKEILAASGREMKYT